MRTRAASHLSSQSARTLRLSAQFRSAASGQPNAVLLELLRRLRPSQNASARGPLLLVTATSPADGDLQRWYTETRLQYDFQVVHHDHAYSLHTRIAGMDVSLASFSKRWLWSRLGCGHTNTSISLDTCTYSCRSPGINTIAIHGGNCRPIAAPALHQV
jgi:hypothetical protein